MTIEQKMVRNRRQMQRGVQWRRNLRNLPARQAAAAAEAAGKQPQPALVAPQPQLQPRARRRVRGRVRGQPRVPPAGRRPIAAGGHGEKNIDNAFIRNRGRYKIKRFLHVFKNVEVKKNGATIRRMVARRRAIYPNLRRQRQY